MTHSDIYTKFMIEYDKANVTSSYPSLTKYEVATILDKAYLALIAQKVSGNNPRKVIMGQDLKSIHDLQELIASQLIDAIDSSEEAEVVKTIKNCKLYLLPDGFLYYIASQSVSANNMLDNVLVPSDIANRNIETDINKPLLKHPLVYIAGNSINVLFSSFDNTNYKLNLIYICKPNMFSDQSTLFSDNVDFELSDIIAEEVINLAILYVLDIVQSQRIQTKTQLNALES